LKKLLIFSPDQKVGNLIADYLKVEYTFESNVYSDLSGALGSVSDQYYDLFVSFDKAQDAEGRELEPAKAILNAVIDHELNTNFLVIGELDIIYANLHKLEPGFKLDFLAREIVNILGVTREEIAYIKKPDYIGVPLENFYQLNEPCCDIFIKISKKDGDQFVKRINAGDEIDKESIKKYQNMNLKEFYIPKDFYENLMAQILNQSMVKLIDAHKVGEKIMEVSSDTFEITQNLLDDLGITAQTVKVARLSIKSMMKTVSSNSKISSLLKEIIQNETSYSFKRSYLISLFFNQILPHLGWGRGEQLQQNLEKVTFVSFFHDAFLRDEKLLKIMNNHQLENSDLTAAEITMIQEHANKASTTVQGVPQCPAGIDVIIRQHHGSRNGIGFPNNLTTSISPMAIAFIVIEDFSARLLEVLERREKLNLKSILEEMEKNYRLPSYLKIIEHLKNLTLK
jgi:response regulator RpfG family c-di-GMP phosphodiesterase